MLPPEIISLFNGTMVGHIGTRDAKLLGCEIMPWGARLNQHDNEITVFIPKSIAAKTISNLENNKRIAVVLGDPSTHEYFQFKGTYCSHFDASAEDEKSIDNFVQRFYHEYLSKHGYPPELLNTFNYKPAIGITFGIEEIYNQTPGPKAGSEILRLKSVV